ncbi:aminotransferase class III-fold pyridoxal phosphate-dependent enzyme [Shigella flexneri]
MHDGVTPDSSTTAKALGRWFPARRVVGNRRVRPRDDRWHDCTTYGGNPLALAAAGKVLELINTPEMLNGVNSVTTGSLSVLDDLITAMVVQ